MRRVPCAFAIYYRQCIAKLCHERHADLDLCARQHVDPRATGKLTTLIGIEDFRPAVSGEGVLQSLHQKSASMLFD